MTRTLRYQLTFRFMALTLALIAAGCSTLAEIATTLEPESSSDLRQGLSLYRSGQIQNAEPLFNAVYDNPEASSADQSQALAAAILILLERNTGNSLDEAGLLLKRYVQLNSEPVEPGLFLLQKSLSSAVAASKEAKNQQTALLAAGRKLDAAQFERRQLEETLRKLRKLSLE